ncbi:hypothetical protein GJ688_20225 [Heliobacillus mobilis]|uniref:Uncharacterized protein n=1 Tax=Heliobacterium mobile TaxID=28064 RepID=A0A6I3SQX3_HELMO|nr:hypothetical protein [Heliobacterium mobile]
MAIIGTASSSKIEYGMRCFTVRLWVRAGLVSTMTADSDPPEEYDGNVTCKLF